MRKDTDLAQPVLIETKRNLSSAGIAYIRSWSPKQRIIRALLTLLAVWIVAALAVLIPILHFILVPLLLLLGPIIASIVYTKKSAVIGGDGVCPACKEKFEVASSRDSWPLSDICSHCSERVKISKSAGTARS